MHPIVKIIIGALLLIGGIAAIWYYTLDEFLLVLKGLVPPFVALVGLFVVWLELDELRIEKELKAEERKAKRKKK